MTIAWWNPATGALVLNEFFVPMRESWPARAEGFVALTLEEPAAPSRPLPVGFVAEGLTLANTGRLYGKTFHEMTREELLASAANGWRRYTDSIEQHSRDEAMLKLLEKRT